MFTLGFARLGPTRPNLAAASRPRLLLMNPACRLSDNRVRPSNEELIYINIIFIVSKKARQFMSGLLSFQ